MDLDELRDRACMKLHLLLPQLDDPSRLVDECLTSARKAFRDDFILSLSPEAWARLALVHVTTFLDSGADVSVGDIVAAVLRDSIHLGRVDMLAQQVGQRQADAQGLIGKPSPEAGTDDKTARAPAVTLTVVKS